MQVEMGQRFRAIRVKCWGRIETQRMSQAATFWHRAALLSAAALFTVSAGWAQSGPASGRAISWRRLGRPSIKTHLAGPSTGSVAAVWYSQDGNTLFAQTPSGQVFETSDLENWIKSDARPPERLQPAVPAQKPESQARVVTVDGDTRRFWSLGEALLSSDDGGISWTNLSGPGEGVIGTGQHAVAIKPDDPSVIAVANDSGVWQSPDGGQSWSGINENLPDLPVARILSTARGALTVGLQDGRTLQLIDSRSSWSATESHGAAQQDASDRQTLGTTLGADITAITHAGDFVYAGSSDGRLWVSRDRGVNWTPAQTAGRGPTTRIYVDSEAPRAALAIFGGPGARVMRTVNAGAVWDDITGNLSTGNLSEMGVHGAAADRASGTAYIATDRGVFMARVDMNAFAPASNWQLLSGPLPAARAVDVALDATGRQLFVALEGYGLYTAPTPIRNGALRLTNAADFSTRPAAPGSVVSVVGGKVTAAQAGDLKFPILASAETESQLQVPFEARSNVDLAIEGSRGSVSLPLAIRSVSPAIFVDPDGSPFLVDADTGLTLDAASSAHPRARLQLMATGLGRVQPDWQTGVPAPAENPPSVVANVKAYLDGVPVEVTKATLAPGYIGYYLIEVQLPTILNAGSAEFYLSADGQDSNKVRLQVDAQYTSASE